MPRLINYLGTLKTLAAYGKVYVLAVDRRVVLAVDREDGLAVDRRIVVAVDREVVDARREIVGYGLVFN